METIKLKNGTEESKPLVAMVYHQIKTMLSEDYKYPMTFWNLYRKCKDKEYIIPDIMQKQLIEEGLMEKDGSIDSSIKNIVLSSVAGEGFKLYVVSPVVQE